MEKLRTIATKAMRSIDRITNVPVALVMKVLSMMGITKAIKANMAKAIRRDRLMRASITLLSPSLVLLLVAIVFVASRGGLEAYLRALVVLLYAATSVYFKFRQVQRRHQMHVARRLRSAQRQV